VTHLSRFDTRPALRCKLLRHQGETLTPIARGFLIVLIVGESLIANGTELRAQAADKPLVGGAFHACGVILSAQVGDILALRLADGRLQPFRVLCVGAKESSTSACALQSDELVAAPAPEVHLDGLSPLTLH
jgi:hypothetical protein